MVVKAEGRRRFRRFSFFALSALVAEMSSVTISTNCFADQLYLKTGDRIIGKFVRFENDRMDFDAAYGQRLEIQRKHLLTLETDSIVTVLFKDNSRRSGMLTAGPMGEMRISASTSDLRPTVTFADVQAIYSGKIVKAPSIRWNGRVNFGVLAESGNTRKTNVALDADATVRSNSDRLFAHADVEFEDTDKGAVTQEAKGRLGYDRFTAGKFFVTALSGFEYDKFKELNLRAVTGAGLGYQPFDGEEANLIVRLAAGWLHEDFYENAYDKDDPAMVWLVHADKYMFGRLIQVFHDMWGIWNLSRTSQVILQTKSGLRFPLPWGFVSTLEFKLDHETETVPGQKENDRTIKLSIGYQW